MTYTKREEQVKELMLSNDIKVMMMWLETFVHQAYIAGYNGSKGVGLNLTVKERAEQYTKERGLTP